MIYFINTLSVFIYLVSCFRILHSFKRGIVLLGFILFFQLWSVISCYYNDFGFYNTELLQYTHPSYATTLLVFFYIVFNLGIRFGFRLKIKSLIRIEYHLFKNISITNIATISALFLSIIIFFDLVLNLTNSSTSIFSRIDRNLLLENANYLAYLLNNFGFILAFLLGYLRPIRRGFCPNDFFLAILILHFLYMGHKFSSPILMFTCYFAPILSRIIFLNKLNSNFTIRLYFYVFALLFIFASITIHHYLESTIDLNDFNEVFFNRIFGFQGHVWWAVNQDNFIMDSSHWIAELNGIISTSSVTSDSYGIKYLMLRILGYDIANPIFDRGYLYTMGYPAILLVSFPLLLGLFFQFILGTFTFFIINYIYLSVNYNHLLRSLVALIVYIPLMNISGNLGTFFTLALPIKIIFLFISNSPFIVRTLSRY